MDGDVSVSQEVIKLLVSERGLSFIKNMSNSHILIAANTAPSTSFWTTEIRPLFQLLTHPTIVESAVLGKEVAAIFNYLLEVCAARMTSLFGYISRLVQSLPAGDPDISCMAGVEPFLAVLSKLLDCNTTNIVNDAFSTLVSLLS